jgi:hypothetical protein
MSGPGAEGGFAYQSQVTAEVIAHLLVGQPLDWFPDSVDVPSAVSAEKGGIGDDLQIELCDGGSIDVQTKHGCNRDVLRDAVLAMLRGLRADTAARAALIIDDTSSLTIRSDFRTDIEQLAGGREDNLHDIAAEIVHLATAPAGDDVWCRFRVVVLSYPLAGSLARSPAAYLREIVTSPEQVATAWQHLVHDARDLIRRRGRRDRIRAIQLLGRHVALRGEAAADHALLRAHRLWTEAAYRAFFSIAVERWLPSTTAWQAVRRIGKDLEASERKEIDAAELLANSQRLLLIGGAGAGKSTLSVRIAYEAATQERIVVRVALREVVRKLLRGLTFSEALADFLVSIAEAPTPKRATVVGSLDVLVADGLDECGTHRALVVQRLVEWSAAHPRCQIVVTSRPYGAEPTPLPTFMSAELSSLGHDDAERIGRNLIELMVDDKAAQAEAMQRLQEVLPVASGAKGLTEVARNPLLLSFLAALAAHGLSLTGNRVDIYTRIVERMARSQRPDRSSQVAITDSLATFVFNLLGWSLTADPTASRAQLRQRIAPEIAKVLGCSKISAEEHFDLAVEFWVEHAVLDRSGVALDETIVFVHQSLADFGAGRCAAEFDDDTLQAWVKRSVAHAVDRDALLFAAAGGASHRIAGYLLETPEDGFCGETLLAASVLAERNEVDPQLGRAVVDRLRDRLVSPSPVVAIDAGLALRSLATTMPSVVTEVVRPFLEHEYPWTRLASLSVALAANATDLPTDVVRQWLEELVPIPTLLFGEQWATERDLPFSAALLQESALPRAIRVIAARVEREAAIAIFERILQLPLDPDLLEHVGLILTTRGFGEIYQTCIADRNRQFSQTLERMRPDRTLEGKMLDLIGSALDVHIKEEAPGSQQTEALSNLAPFFRVLKIDSFESILIPAHIEVVEEIVRAIAEACRVDRESLRDEIMQARAVISQKEYPLSIFSLMREKIPQADWSRGARNRSIPLLAKGLVHPSDGVKNAAVHLLANGEFGEDVLGPLVENSLREGNSVTLQYVSWLAEECLSADRASAAFLDRANGRPLRGCGYLFFAMQRLFGRCAPAMQARIREALLAGLTIDNTEAATDAANVVAEMFHIDDIAATEAITAAFEHWSVQRGNCSRCAAPLKDGSCPSCHTAYRSPLPILLRLLESRSPIATSRLLPLCGDRTMDLPKVAFDIVAARMSADSGVTSYVLDAIQRNVPELRVAPRLRLLQAVLALAPAKLAQHVGNLTSLLDSPVPQIRERALAGVSLFTTPEEAEQQVRRALNDSSPSVRSAAALAMRKLVRRDTTSSLVT